MYRRLALRWITEQFPAEAISLYQFALTNDPEFTMRTTSAKRLIQLDSLNANILLKERIISDTTMEARIIFSTLILDNYGTPEDLKFIIDYHPNEPDLYARDFIDKAIITFKPPRPTLSTAEMIQNLQAYTDELFQYGWITEQNTYHDYIKLTEIIRDSYSAKEFENLCENLKQLILIAEQQRNTPLLTEEGYKFLFYYGNFIRDSIASEYGGCK
jgi:hypothetical protein